MADHLRNSLSVRDVDQAITALKKGSYLLKYGRRGKPKLCPFQLSTDESALIWYSGKEEKQIKLSEVLRIIPGQRTATFKRYPRPEKEYQSFSLIFQDRSLDLICKDKDEAEVWFVGLKAIITRLRAGKLRSNINCESTASDSPSTRARRISPFVTVFEPVIQGPDENAAQNRLGKVFSDIVSITAPTSKNQTEPFAHSLSSLSTGYVDNSNPRSSTGEPVRVSLSSAVSSSSQGSYHEDFDALGDVYIWGEGISDGVLGGTQNSSNSNKQDALVPQPLESTVALDVHNIACGSRHAVLVTRKGEIFSWGEESGGRLGHGVESDVPQPRLIDALSGMSFETIACGEFHTCAATISGEFYTWGDDSHKSGMLGHGSEAGHWFPKKITGILDGLRVCDVSCGPWHTAIVTSSGQLFTFGDGSFGALGHGDRCSTSIPRELETLTGFRTTRIACGVWHTAAVVEVVTETTDSELSSSTGQLFTWGDGDNGQLGHGDTELKLFPECVTALTDENICRVACGHNLTIVLTARGHVYTMGSTAFGQLGNPRAEGKIPTRVEDSIANSLVDEISCGSYHVAVLTSKSEVFTWGKGSNGQLGHGVTENRKTPTLVEFFRDKQAKAVTCGSNFTAVICIHKWAFGSDHSVCAGCRNPFKFRRKRHNCYNCGLAFCKVCSSRKSLKAALAPDMNKPCRVCYGCFAKLKKSVEASGNHGNRNRTCTDILDRDSFGLKLLAHHSRISSNDSIMQSEGRNSKRDCVLAPANGNVLLAGLISPRGSVLLAGAPKNKSVNVSGSRMSSLTASPVLGKSSPPRLAEVTVDDSKHSTDKLSQEVASLKAQVEEITRKSRHLEEELEKTRKQLKVVTAMAVDEAEQCRRAKEVIRSLTAQRKEMAERVQRKDGGSSRNPTARDNYCDVQNKVSTENHRSRMVSHGNEPNGNIVNTSLVNGTNTQTEKAERVVLYEPGVYLTLFSLRGGGNELKRVRFSRRRFTEDQAEKWWAENEGKVCERHNIRVA